MVGPLARSHKVGEPIRGRRGKRGLKGTEKLGHSPGRQYAGSVATREELKAEVERIGRDHGHTLGIWLDLGHASQLGCLGCDRYAFVQVLPPPGQAFTEAFEQPCPDRGQRLIETPE